MKAKATTRLLGYELRRPHNIDDFEDARVGWQITSYDVDKGGRGEVERQVC